MSLFTQVINPSTPLIIQFIYGLQMFVMTFTWFALIAVIMMHSIIKQRFLSVSQAIEKIMGAILVALGVKVALSATKQ